MKLIKSIFMISSVLILAIAATNSVFSDTAKVDNNEFSTGTWHVAQARMVINEVYYRGSHEWIELYNAGDATADIKGWIICDNAAHCGTLNPAIKTEVGPGDFVVVAHDADDLSGWTIPASVAKIYYAGATIAFNDTPGDSVILKDDSSIVIDMMSYGNDTTAFNPACPLVASGHSLERNPDGVDTNTAADFVDRATPTPGS
jgi:predicted ribosomally synthesized peptide with SipW-like signal peptide